MQTMFLGIHTGRVDAQNRVSIPRQFRNHIDTIEIILRCDRNKGAFYIPNADMQALYQTHLLGKGVIEDILTKDIDITSVLFGSMYELTISYEGRIRIPKKLLAELEIIDTVSFVGMGRVFVLCSPHTAEHRMALARERAASRLEP